MTENERAKEILEEVYNEAVDSFSFDIPVPGIADLDEKHLETVIHNQETRKAAVAVLVTLLLKKVLNPSQDIHLHRAEFDGGFSGRRLDTQIVTPLLRSKQFPSMSESGWLTRSFEQSHPFDFDYPGNITPKALKRSFLSLIDVAQRQGATIAERFLLRLFIGLVEARDKNTNLKLARPVHLSIAELVDRLRQHHDVNASGAARLPVLAVHAILTILAREADRYRNCTLLELEAHTAADSRSNLIGDINVVDADGALFEGYEIKHNVPITADLIHSSFEKLQTTPVKVYYILTTYSHASYDEFRPNIENVARTHGCQLIVNGVDRTLLYYLRLIGETRSFVDAYVSHLEKDSTITFELKESWNQIAAGK